MKEKVAVFTEKCECSDLFTIVENKYRTEVSLYKDKKIVQEAGLEPARYCYHRHLKPARLPIPPLPRIVSVKLTRNSQRIYYYMD